MLMVSGLDQEMNELVSVSVGQRCVAHRFCPGPVFLWPAGEQSAGEQSAGEQSAGEQSAGEQSAGEQSAGEQSAGKQSAGDPSAGDRSATTIPASRTSAVPLEKGGGGGGDGRQAGRLGGFTLTA